MTESGEVIGHLGGACVTRAVQKAALVAPAEGDPQVIRVKPKDKVVALRDADGTQVYKSGCPSGGTVELLIEPYSRAPMLCILGDTPIARAVAAHGALAGFRIALHEEVPFDGACQRFEGAEPDPLELSERDEVVMATQGQGDLTCLKAARQSAADNVTIVAARFGRPADLSAVKMADDPLRRWPRRRDTLPPDRSHLSGHREQTHARIAKLGSLRVFLAIAKIHAPAGFRIGGPSQLGADCAPQAEEEQTA